MAKETPQETLQRKLKRYQCSENAELILCNTATFIANHHTTLTHEQIERVIRITFPHYSDLQARMFADHLINRSKNTDTTTTT